MYLKLHVIIQLDSMIILGIRVTRWTKHDSPVLDELLRFMKEDEEILCADSAYLSRRSCKLIAKKGRVPFIKSKKNSLKKDDRAIQRV